MPQKRIWVVVEWNRKTPDLKKKKNFLGQENPTHHQATTPDDCEVQTALPQFNLEK